MIGCDLNGKPGGKTGTGTVVIKVLDVNDNPPTLEKDEVVLFLILVKAEMCFNESFRVARFTFFC